MIAAVRGPWVGAALVGTTSFAPVHAVDWLPTIVHAATGDADWQKLAPAGEPPYLDGDGMSVLDTVRAGKAVRTELLLECHPGPSGIGAPIEHGPPRATIARARTHPLAAPAHAWRAVR